MKKFLLIILILFPFSSLNASEVCVTYEIQLGFSTNRDIQRSKYQVDLSSLVSRNKFIYFNRRVLHQKRSKRGEDWRFSWMGNTHVSKVNCKENIEFHNIHFSNDEIIQLYKLIYNNKYTIINKTHYIRMLTNMDIAMKSSVFSNFTIAL